MKVTGLLLIFSVISVLLLITRSYLEEWFQSQCVGFGVEDEGDRFVVDLFSNFHLHVSCVDHLDLRLGLHDHWCLHSSSPVETQVVRVSQVPAEMSHKGPVFFQPWRTDINLYI